VIAISDFLSLCCVVNISASLQFRKSAYGTSNAELCYTGKHSNVIIAKQMSSWCCFECYSLPVGMPLRLPSVTERHIAQLSF
jgi:hypothetical protein